MNSLIFPSIEENAVDESNSFCTYVNQRKVDVIKCNKERRNAIIRPTSTNVISGETDDLISLALSDAIKKCNKNIFSMSDSDAPKETLFTFIDSQTPQIKELEKADSDVVDSDEQKNVTTSAHVQNEEGGCGDNKDIVQLVVSQTNYTIEEVREKLVEYDNDYMSIIMDYVSPIKKVNENKTKSINQQIYATIRNKIDISDFNKKQEEKYKNIQLLE